MRKLGITISKKDLEKEVELLREVAKDNYNRMYDLEEDVQREREKCDYYKKLYELNRNNYSALKEEYDKMSAELSEYKKAYNNQIR